MDKPSFACHMLTHTVVSWGHVWGDVLLTHSTLGVMTLRRGIFQRNLGLRGWWVDWVRDIVLNMHGQDLTALKNAMDDGGDAHNIHKLIYNDILVCSIVTAASSMSVLTLKLQIQGTYQTVNVTARTYGRFYCACQVWDIQVESGVSKTKKGIAQVLHSRCSCCVRLCPMQQQVHHICATSW